VVAVAMNRGGKAYHRHTHALPCHRSCCLLRSNAGMRELTASFSVARRPRCDDDRSTRGDDSRGGESNERGAESLDGAPSISQ